MVRDSSDKDEEIFKQYLEGDLEEDEAKERLNGSWEDVRYRVVVEGDIDSLMEDT